MGFPTVLLILAMAQGAQFPGMNVAEPSQAGDARIELSFDRPSYVLGEPVLLRFCIVNVSNRPFDVEIGGDYRGGSRSTRFKVSVTNGAGVAMPDPDPSGFNLGGASTVRQVAPGGRECRSLLLMRYVRIDQPGTFSIRATHDLGWKTSTPPGGTTTIALTMPGAEEANRVLDATLALPDLEDYAPGTMDVVRPRRDFSVLRYPVYLAPLVRLAEGGNVEALTGIGSIPTAEATRALVGLMRHANRELARDASRELASRLPDPALEGRLPRRGPFNNELEDPRRYLRDASWRPEFAVDVRRTATDWLTADDPALVIQAAFMMEATGTAADAPAISRGLDRALERTLTLPFEKGGYPRPRGAMQELMRATDVMVSIGYVPPAAPATPGDAALWLTAFGKGARPENWRTTMRSLLDHRIPYIRELALQRLPDDAPAELLAAVGPALQHTDLDLQMAALDAISRLKLPGYEPRLKEIVRSATDFMLFNCASNALSATAGPVALYQLMTERLNEPDMFNRAMSTLLYGTLQVAGAGGGPVSEDVRQSLATRWQAFLETHRADIAAGKRFPLDDPAVAGLIPPGWNVRPSGK
jgi:hypothetical protein